MVDLKTAMAAAQAEQRKKAASSMEEKKKRRSGPDLGIEPFDPVKYVTKERAETASMWLVIAYAIIITMVMRYLLMPGTDRNNADILYMFPLVMIILIPQIHRMVMPKKFVEVYGKGTWFKASFLHTFTFLSVAFLLTNPPFADVVAPQVSSTWVIGVEEDSGLVYSNDSGRGGVTHWQLTGSDTVLEGPIWLFFGLADNVNSDGATVEVTLKNNDGEESLSMDDMYWESNFDAIVNGTRLDNSSIPNLLPHGGLDQPVAVSLGSDLAPGTHTIEVKIIEDGNPWKNTRIYTWKFEILTSQTLVQ
jgi:hypothetical protein